MNLSAFMPTWLSDENAFLSMIASAAFMAVIALYKVMIERDPFAARIKSLKERRNVLKAAAIAPARRQNSIRGYGFMRDVVRRLKLARMRKANTAPQRLAAAGWRSKDAIVVFLFFKVATPLTFGGIAALALFGLGFYDLPFVAKFGLSAMFAGIGFYLPNLMVRNQAMKRQQAIRKGLPDALDLLVICAEAGLSIDAAFTRVSREMAKGAPIVADEFGLAAIELGFLPDRAMALQNLASRTEMAEIRGMVNTLLQTEKYGTPLAQALRVLSAEFRDQRLMRAEEKAARLPAILTVPMIIFILPCLFIVLLGPAALRTIDALSGMM